MTAMTDAMKKAGVFVPLNKRVWMHLKDHPGKSIKQVAQAFSADERRVGLAVRDLESRNMIYHVKEEMAYRKGMPGRHNINIYYCVGNKYELLPVRKQEKPKPKVDPAPVVKTEPPKPKKLTIENLSVIEAKELYEELKKIFG